MIALFAKLFFAGTDENKIRKAYGTLCSIVGILLNVLLFAGKYFAGLISGSIAIMADAFNNLSDAGSSFITLVGFWFAGKKPDLEHPFGHGRFEYLSGLGVAVLIIVMGVELARDSVIKIITPQPLETSDLTLIILLISIAVKIYMFAYNRTIGQKIESTAMKATAMDSISDAGATTVVLCTMLINRVWDINIDGICGFVVSIVIMYAGYGIAKDTMSPLLGQPPKKEFVDAIYDIVMAHDGIRGVHDLVVHDYGPGRVMISLHTEVPGNEDIFRIHDLIDQIENELNMKLGCEAVIHMDPVEVDNEDVDNMKNTVKHIVKDIDRHMSMHDFRVLTYDTHTNLIFDVVVPYSVNVDDDVVKERIQEELLKIDRKFVSVVHIDRDSVR